MSKTKEITFVIDDITFKLTLALPEKGKPAGAGGGIESNIDEKMIGSMRADRTYYARKDALYSFLLAYACAGGDVKSTACYAGIRASLDSLVHSFM